MYCADPSTTNSLNLYEGESKLATQYLQVNLGTNILGIGLSAYSVQCRSYRYFLFSNFHVAWSYVRPLPTAT